MAEKTWTGAVNGNFQTAGNWSDSVAPANSDTLHFTGASNVSVNAGLSNTLTGVTLVVDKSYAGSIGTISGATYDYLTLDGGTINIGQGGGGPGFQPGSPQLMFGNTGATAMTFNVNDSGSSSNNGVHPPILINGGTAITLNQSGGSVGVAVNPGTTATLASVKLTKNADAQIPTQLFLGRGVTLTLLQARDALILSRAVAAATTVRIDANATYRFIGAFAHTTVEVFEGGTVQYEGTGTISTLRIAGTFDRTKGNQSLTITDVHMEAGGALLMDNGVAGSVTLTNGIVLDSCGLQDVTISHVGAAAGTTIQIS